MNKYTIYCTPEQTKKVVKLGAPIKEAMSKYNAKIAYKNIEQGKESLDDYTKNGVTFIASEFSARAYLIPTAEQMLGWLIDKLQITTWHINYFPTAEKYGYTIIALDFVIEHGRVALSNELYASRKEATLAAIDAALEYLTNNKEVV